MLLITALRLTAALLSLAPAKAPDPQQATTIRRIATSTSLAAEEYAVGIAGGKVVAAEEVDEAKLFLQEARRSAGLLPPDVGNGVLSSIDSLLEMVVRVAPPDSVTLRARALASALAQKFGITLEEIPARLPRWPWANRSTRPNAPPVMAVWVGVMVPPPSDSPQFRPISPISASWPMPTPLDFYRRITIGVAGTAMPSYESRLTAEERWAVASYASTLATAQRRGARCRRRS